MKIEIELQVAPADSIKFYHGEKFDESGNIIGKDTPEERTEWFESNKGKVRHRLIATVEGKRNTLEGPIVIPEETPSALSKIFERLGTDIAKLL